MASKETILGGRIAVIGNAFYGSGDSAIKWVGDDNSTSEGGSVISSNRIYNPNQNGTRGPVNYYGVSTALAAILPCGISVSESAGLSIIGNTINDTSGEMEYSMQLLSSPPVGPPGPSERILVADNLCGTALGVGNGANGTFFLGAPSAQNPNPMLLKNLNQLTGLDSSVSIINATPWPGAGGYPYDALVCITGGTMVGIQIQGGNTLCNDGTFYVPVGQQIAVNWSAAGHPPPTIVVFRM